MRIGFDAKRYVHNQTGLGNYSRSLVQSLSNHYPDNEYLLFDRKPPKDSTDPSVQFIGPKGVSLFWRQIGISISIEKEKIDVFHGLSAELPLIRPQNTRLIVTVHDLIFLKYPEYYRFFDRLIYLLKLRNAVRMADKVICSSDLTRRDLIELMPMYSKKMDVVAQGCHPLFYAKSDNTDLQKFVTRNNLPDKFLLSVSSFEKRKNHLRLIEAWELLSDSARLPLVLVGKPGDAIDAVVNKCHQYGDKIRIVQDADIHSLKQYYELATLVVLPSEYEGFGIPALESMACGTPVLTGVDSSMEEITGRSALFFNPLSSESIAKSIEKALKPGNLENLKIAQMEQLPKFTSEHIAEQHVNLYKSIAVR